MLLERLQCNEDYSCTSSVLEGPHHVQIHNSQRMQQSTGKIYARYLYTLFFSTPVST